MSKLYRTLHDDLMSFNGYTPSPKEVEEAWNKLKEKHELLKRQEDERHTKRSTETISRN